MHRNMILENHQNCDRKDPKQKVDGQKDKTEKTRWHDQKCNNNFNKIQYTVG